MAEDDRNATRGKARTGSGKQPISRHPLFPATVAIWFGALFGLGSLAIRPALLESAVLATHIDSVVAAAAPPLGITARILLALAMAGLGGLIGATIARRMGRPKQAKAERKRGAMSVLSRKAPEPAPRRRPLTIDDSDLHQDYREHAPLPGGAPQILNVNDFAFDEPTDDAASAEPIEAPVSHFPAPAMPPVVPTQFDEPVAAAPDALDLTAFHAEPAQPGHAEPEAPVDRWSPPAAPAFAPPAYQPPAFEPPAFEASRLSKPAEAVEPADAGEPLDLGAGEPYSPFADRAFEAPEDFGKRPFAAPSEQITPVPEASESSSSVIAAWSQDAATAPPLFAPQGVSEEARAVLAGANAPRPFDAPQGGAPRAFDAPAAVPVAYEPPGPEARTEEPLAPEPLTMPLAHEPEPDPEPASPFAPLSQEPAMTAAAEPQAEPRVAIADLVGLSQADLLERLALSLKRRRAREANAPVAAPVDEPAAPPQAIADAPVDEPGPLARFAPEPQPEPVAAPAPVAQIPAALRPVGLDDADFDDSLPSFVPPRSFALPAEPAQPAPASAPEAAPVEPPAPFTQAQADEEPEGEESLALEDGYSSLLNLSRPAGARQQFVRIDEPEPEAGEIEPVVVFPGQQSGGAQLAAVPSTPAPAFAPEPAEVAAPAGSRPFDAPDSATARPVQQDPEETERALRAALASLQRISGAA